MSSDSVNKLSLDEYRIIFRSIHDRYIQYCSEWEKVREIEINLKKKYICDIYDSQNQLNLEFQKYLYSFKENLISLQVMCTADINREISLHEKAKFIGRVKTEDSIYNKIYRKANESNGKFPINGYMNDLLGFRLIDPYYKENYEVFNKLLSDFKDNGYNLKLLDRNNNGYKAYHIYLKKDNRTFPIELQIWDQEDEKENISLHKEYKQSYVDSIITNYNNL
ncbi:RelA/SpoT domain-containing protein [Clostridium sp. YIM B02506]|uniref:RelA/SpoT domain-containing protein n=1 Tax=Clostridium sp. YIM B02506 TaxID=2910680 RepID=UPI001EEF73E1|nr:RelA/SpoT domain-containing protein [Clostridium sp. YIM B02506]